MANFGLLIEQLDRGETYGEVDVWICIGSRNHRIAGGNGKRTALGCWLLENGRFGNDHLGIGLDGHRKCTTKEPVHFINVGQAEAILLELERDAILIDAGGERTCDGDQLTLRNRPYKLGRILADYASNPIELCSVKLTSLVPLSMFMAKRMIMRYEI